MNMTGLTGINTLQGLAYYTNNSVDGILFTGGSIVLFFIMFMVLLRNGERFENVLAVSSWVMFLITILLWFAQLLPTMMPLAFLMIAGFSTLYLYASK